MRRLLVVPLVATVLALAAPAGAITYGAPDGTAHPNVGSLVLRVNGTPYQVCTGTLVAPKVFLTAAHCFYDLPGVTFEVTFDPVITAGGTFYSGHGVFDPRYTDYRGAGGSSDPHDVAVFLLDRAPSGIAPAPVAPVGALVRRDVRGTAVVAVGYGTVRATRTKAAVSILDNVERRQGTGTVRTVENAWLRVSGNQATGDAGTCYGDSGGPHFIGATVVAITSTGDTQCKATDVDYRVDTVAAHQFLDPYLSG